MDGLDHAEAVYLAGQLDAIDFDHVFVMDGSVCALRMVDSPVHAPEVMNSLDPETDIVIFGDPAWTALKGNTGQQGYNGAVMHPSEHIGPGIAREMSELAQEEPVTFVVVEVAPELECDDDNAVVGWVILYRENTVPDFKCEFPSD